MSFCSSKIVWNVDVVELIALIESGSILCFLDFT